MSSEDLQNVSPRSEKNIPKILLTIGGIGFGILVLLLTIVFVFGRSNKNDSESRAVTVVEETTPTVQAMPKPTKLSLAGLVAKLEYLENHREQTDDILRELMDLTKYSGHSYLSLCDFAAASDVHGIDTLTIFYDNLIVDREQVEISRISEMSLDDAAEYYRTNAESLPFLADFLEEALLPGLDTLPYKTVRHMHELFAGTPVLYAVDDVFQEMRDTVLVEAREELNEIFGQEEQYLAYLQDIMAHSMESYVDSALVTILEKGMERAEESMWNEAKRIRKHNKEISDDKLKEKLFKSKDKSADVLCNYFSTLCYEKFKSSVVKDTLNLYLENYVRDCKSVRQDYLAYWADDRAVNDTLFAPEHSKYIANVSSMKIPLDDIKDIAINSFNSRVQSAVWDVVGFIPVVGDLLTLPDILWNTYRDRKESKEKQEALNGFCSELREVALKSYLSVIDVTCAIYMTKLYESQESLMRYVNENV